LSSGVPPQGRTLRLSIISFLKKLEDHYQQAIVEDRRTITVLLRESSTASTSFLLAEIA
jgi:hypothetical protein